MARLPSLFVSQEPPTQETAVMPSGSTIKPDQVARVNFIPSGWLRVRQIKKPMTRFASLQGSNPLGM